MLEDVAMFAVAFVCCSNHELRVDSWEDVQFHNETALMAAVSKTPVIVAICVGPALDDWHHYTGGACGCSRHCAVVTSTDPSHVAGDVLPDCVVPMVR